MALARLLCNHSTWIVSIVTLVFCLNAWSGDESRPSKTKPSATEAIKSLIVSGNGVIWRNSPTGTTIESVTLRTRPVAPPILAHDFRELSALHLSYQGITAADVRWAAGMTRVTSLTLDGTGLAWSDATVPEIAQSLRDLHEQMVPTDISSVGNCSQVRELLLWMTPSDTQQLRALSKLTHLTELDLLLPKNSPLSRILVKLPPSLRRLCLRNITAAHLTSVPSNSAHLDNVDELSLWLAEDASKEFRVRGLLSCVPKVSVVRMYNGTITAEVARDLPMSVTALHFARCNVTTKALLYLSKLPQLSLLELHRCRLVTSVSVGHAAGDETVRGGLTFRGLRLWGTEPHRCLLEGGTLQAVEELVFHAVRYAQFDPSDTPRLKSLSVQFGTGDLRRLTVCPQTLRAIEFKCRPELPEDLVESFVRRENVKIVSLKYCGFAKGKVAEKQLERARPLEVLVMYRCRNIPDSVFQAVRHRGGADGLLVSGGAESVAIKAIHSSSPALRRMVVDLSFTYPRNQERWQTSLRLKTVAPRLRQLVVTGPAERTLDVVKSAPRELKQLHIHLDSNDGETVDLAELLPAKGGHQIVHLKLSGDIVRCKSLGNTKYSTIEFCASPTGSPVNTRKMLLTTISPSGNRSQRGRRIPGPLAAGLWGTPSPFNEWWLGR